MLEKYNMKKCPASKSIPPNYRFEIEKKCIFFCLLNKNVTKMVRIAAWQFKIKKGMIYFLTNIFVKTKIMYKKNKKMEKIKHETKSIFFR